MSTKYSITKINGIEPDTNGEINITTVPYKKSIVPTDSPEGTGEAVWTATQAGTYTNFGGVVVNANSIATISRNAEGAFSISQTLIDLVSKADLIIGKNLFNKATAVIGSRLNDNNTVTVDAVYDYSDYIKVLPNTQYTTSRNTRFRCYYTANKTYISGGSNLSVTTFTTPANCEFVRVTFAHTVLDVYQLEIGAVSTLYEDYKFSVPLTQIPTLPYRQTTSTLPLSLNETDWATLGKNLFNKATVTLDRFVNWTDGIIITNTSYTASDFISILPNTQYVSTALAHYAFYTVHKTFISGSNTNTIALSPSNAAYIRFSFIKSLINVAQLEVGSTATSYDSYGYTAPTLKVDSSVGSKPWSNIITNCLGDSLTQGNQWQPYLVTNLGLLITNFGVGGTRISGSGTTAMNNDARVNLLSNSAQLVIVMGGTNDWAQSVTLGADNSIDVTTFNGALNVLIEKLLVKYHTAGALTKFLFIGTPYGEFIDYVSRGWSTPVLNTQGLTTKDYSEAIRNRCSAYNIPFCDPANLGWNSFNVSDYLANDGAYLHPNSIGGKRLAEIVAGKLKSIEPLSD